MPNLLKLSICNLNKFTTQKWKLTEPKYSTSQGLSKDILFTNFGHTNLYLLSNSLKLSICNLK